MTQRKRGIQTNLKPRTPSPDWKPIIVEMVAQADKTLAPHASAGVNRADTRTQSATLGLLRAAARLAQLSFDHPDLGVGDLKQAWRALSRLESILYDEEFA